MNEIKPHETIKSKTIVERMCHLAYCAAQPVGMGFLQERPGVTEQMVIACADGKEHIYSYTPKQVATHYTLDYCFGRMMKLSIWIMPDQTIRFGQDNLSTAYQSWARVYPSYEALYNEAVKSLTASKP